MASTSHLRPDSLDELLRAARALDRHGLVNAFGHVSMRIGVTVVVTPPRPLGAVELDGLVSFPLEAPELPAGAPPETWAHIAVYRARPEVRSVVRAMPPSGFAAAAALGSSRAGAPPASMPVLHGQSAWLGSSVPVHDDARLLRTCELADAMATRLGDANAVLFRGNGAVTVADRPGIAMARMYLLEAACRTWLDSASVGTPTPLTGEEIAAWQSTTDQLVPRLWEFLDGAAVAGSL